MNVLRIYQRFVATKTEMEIAQSSLVDGGQMMHGVGKMPPQPKRKAVAHVRTENGGECDDLKAQHEYISDFKITKSCMFGRKPDNAKVSTLRRSDTDA